MKIAVYAVRKDELEELQRMEEKYGVALKITQEEPSMENLELVKGCIGISVLGQVKIDRSFLDTWYGEGVRYISTRTIGYNHIDVEYAKSLGIRVCNARYAPNGVADFTVMMILMCLRQYKQAMWRGQVNDFSLEGLQGREMKDLTVGVVGTGRIGAQVMRNLSGFGCRILACDHHPNPALESLAAYVEFEEILKQCDIITLHMPLVESNRHMINRETIAKMRTGVILINCSRGELMDIEALIEGIETEKIGALGMDTSEGGGRHHPRRSPDGYFAEPELVLSASVPQRHHDTAHGILYGCGGKQYGTVRYRRYL